LSLISPKDGGIVCASLSLTHRENRRPLCASLPTYTHREAYRKVTTLYTHREAYKEVYPPYTHHGRHIREVYLPYTHHGRHIGRHIYQVIPSWKASREAYIPGYTLLGG